MSSTFVAMDRRKIEAWTAASSTRLLVSSRQGSRRAALAPSSAPPSSAAIRATVLAKNGRKGKVKAQAKAKAKAKPCYPGTTCTPGKGKNTSGCDFTGSTVLPGRDVRGSNLSNSNFTGAQLAGADLRGTNLSGACLHNANLLDAKLGASVNLGNAIFCRTLMPDGSLNDRDCDRGTRCCPTACEGEDCESGDCVRLDVLCSAFGNLCCGDTVCTPTAFPFVTTCQSPCDDDFECQAKFFPSDVVCETDLNVCGNIGTCCRPKSCTEDADCTHSQSCCRNVIGHNVCCLDGQHCTENNGCQY